MQAVECRIRFHRRAQIEPPNLRKKPASTKKIHAPATPEQDEEQYQGRRALWEAFEENALWKVSGFQTGQIPRLSDRRSHRRDHRNGGTLTEMWGGAWELEHLNENAAYCPNCPNSSHTVARHDFAVARGKALCDIAFTASSTRRSRIIAGRSGG
ncbi:MAG: hypothetical protein WC076_02430 [Terrimicrobiaceae bacterium]